MLRPILATLLASALASSAMALPDYRLDGPHLYRANSRAGGLSVGDFNGDGLLDFCVVANDEGVLKVFSQTADPNAEDRFVAEDVTLDRLVRAALPADVNGDGRTDLIVAGSPSSLAVLYQSKEGRLQPPQEAELPADYIALGDLNGDERDDLLVVADKKMSILPSTRRGISLEPAQSFFTVSQVTNPPLLVDLDGDGKRDIVFSPGDRRDTVIIRLQSPEGDFPAEFTAKPGFLRALDRVERTGRRGALSAIHGQTRQLLLLGLADGVEESSPETLTLGDPTVVAFDPDVIADKTFSATADVDGDGRLDLLVAIPDSASLRIVRQSRTGSLQPEVVPCMSDVTDILPWDAGRGKPTPLLVLSGREKAIGVAQADPDNRSSLLFPRPLPLKSRPLAMARARVAGSQAPALIVVENAGEKRNAVSAYPGFDPAKAELPTAKTLLNLDSSSEDPTGIAARDFDGDGLDDLVVFYRFNAPELYMQDAKGNFAAREATGALAGLLADSSPRRLLPGTLRGAKESSLLAIRPEFVRAFSLAKSGEPAVAEQFNGRNSRSRIVSATVADLREADSREVVLLDSANKIVTIYGRPKDDGRYELLRNVEVADTDYQQVLAFDLDGDSRDDILLLAPDRVTVIPSRNVWGGLETMASYRTDVEDGGYGAVTALDWEGTVDPELLLVEMKENMLDFIRIGGTKKSDEELTRTYGFQVFDSEGGPNRRVNLDAPPEPRELRVADLDGDGRRDLLAVMHEYVAVYYGRERE